jgi:hypothetical protein
VTAGYLRERAAGEAALGNEYCADVPICAADLGDRAINGDHLDFLKGAESPGSGKHASYSAPDAVSFYLCPLPAGIRENKVTIRSTRWARMYRRLHRTCVPDAVLDAVADRCVVRDADRAKDIVGRMRDRIKNSPPPGRTHNIYVVAGFIDAAAANKDPVEYRGALLQITRKRCTCLTVTMDTPLK